MRRKDAEREETIGGGEIEGEKKSKRKVGWLEEIRVSRAYISPLKLAGRLNCFISYDQFTQLNL